MLIFEVPGFIKMYDPSSKYKKNGLPSFDLPINHKGQTIIFYHLALDIGQIHNLLSKKNIQKILL